MPSGIRPTVDYAFKRVFGCEENKAVLVDLLNAVLVDSGQTPVREIEILNPFSQQDTYDERAIILDLKARDELGREALIEMQMMSHRAFRERLMYGLAKHYSKSLKEGEPFTRLRPLIVVCFIASMLCPETAEYHSRYELRDPKSGNLFSNHWTIHIVELPKFDLPPQQLKSSIDRWAYFLKHGAELDINNLPDELRTPSILQATGTLITMSQNTVDSDRYNARMMFIGDYATGIDDAREEGRLEGRVIGREEGREEGMRQTLRSTVLAIGRRRFGTVPAAVEQFVGQTSDISTLERLRDLILDCPSWESLIS